jgi:hypothetical protein
MSEVATHGTAVTVEPVQPPLPPEPVLTGTGDQGRHSQAHSLTDDGAATSP